MFTLKDIDSKYSELLSKLSVDTFVQAYTDIHSQADLNIYCSDAYSVSSIEVMLNQDNIEATVAFLGDIPAGFCVLKHCPCPVKLVGPSSELKQLYVLSGYFGSGLGNKLFQHVVSNAVSHKRRWLWLCVSNLNDRAQAFYKKLGFSNVGEGPKLIVGKDVLPSSIMALDIGAVRANVVEN